MAKNRRNDKERHDSRQKHEKYKSADADGRESDNEQDNDEDLKERHKNTKVNQQQEKMTMAKEQMLAQMVTWSDTVSTGSGDKSARDIKREINDNFSTTMDGFDATNLTTEEQDTIIAQISSITDGLIVDTGAYEFISAYLVNWLVIFFAPTDRADEITLKALDEMIASWSTNDSARQRHVAIDAVGQITVTLQSQNRMSGDYATKIFTLFSQAAADGDANVRRCSSEILIDIVKAFLGTFSGSPGIDTYISTLYSAMDNLIQDNDPRVRSAAANGMSQVIDTLHQNGQLETYAEKTLVVIGSFVSDTNVQVRAVAVDILGKLLVPLSTMDGYESNTTQTLAALNNLTFDENTGIRKHATNALQNSLDSIAETYLITLVGLAKFETIINLDLHNSTNSTVKNAVISAIPGKLDDYNTRFNESDETDAANAAASPDELMDKDTTKAAIIVNNISVITGLLSIIGDVGPLDTAELQAAAASAQTNLDRIRDKIVAFGGENSGVNDFYNIIKWINNNFDTLAAQSSTASKAFFQPIFEAAVTQPFITVMDAAFATKCINANYDFVTTEDIATIVARLNERFTKYSTFTSDEQTAYTESCEAILRTELTNTITDTDLELATQCLDAEYGFVLSVDKQARTYTMTEEDGAGLIGDLLGGLGI